MIIVHGPEPVKTSMVNREPIAEPGSWFVYQSPRGKFSVVDSGNRISQIEIKADNYKNRFTVRKASIPFNYKSEYQSKNPGRSFHVSIHVKAITQDPVLILQSEVSDVVDMLKGDIDYWLSQLCGQYKIEELQQLKLASRNMEANTEFKSEVKSKGFLVTNLDVNISLSNEDMAFYRTQEQIKQNEEIERVKLAEMKRTRELKIKAEEEELERQRQRQKLEQQEQLQAEQEELQRQRQLEELKRQERLQAEEEEEKRRQKLKEEKRADKERLVQRLKEGGPNSIIFERDEEHAENVDIILSREDQEKEHQRKLELARYEAELEEKKKSEEHKRQMEIKQMETLQTLMMAQLKSNNPDENVMRTIINAFEGSNNNSTVLVEKKTDDPLLSWEKESSEPLEDSRKKTADTSENTWQ